LKIDEAKIKKKIFDEKLENNILLDNKNYDNSYVMLNFLDLKCGLQYKATRDSFTDNNFKSKCEKNTQRF